MIFQLPLFAGFESSNLKRAIQHKNEKGESLKRNPPDFRSIPNIGGLRLLEISGANAAGAELHGLDSAVFNNLHILKIDLKGTLHILHHMHTDAACLLSQTAPGDATAIAADLAAECADFAHFTESFVL